MRKKTRRTRTRRPPPWACSPRFSLHVPGGRGDAKRGLCCRIDCERLHSRNARPAHDPSVARGVAGPAGQLPFPARFPQPVRTTITQSRLRAAAITAPVSHQKRSQRDATNTIKRVKSSGKSTLATLVPPLITVWLEVRVLPGPPAATAVKSHSTPRACARNAGSGAAKLLNRRQPAATTAPA